ncbi:MAG: hypothetical protein A2498_00910 [Lentisphaerae bacterium RIFOXYC12_FULL_60_16]|nr:MAG: hypothetical protein A2498_00910 [Lentisphaerae bacterium RIFOXYC12_FULL_60_16]
MIVGSYETTIPGGRSRDLPKMHLEAGSTGQTVILKMWRADKKADELWTEMTVAETKKLVEGLLDAMTDRCGLTFEKRNRFCKSLEMHPTKRGS